MKSQLMRLAIALEARGETRDLNARTGKYIVYTRKNVGGNPELFLYLGKSGALRTGKNSTGSVPVSEAFKKQLLAEADAILATNRKAKPAWMA